MIGDEIDVYGSPEELVEKVRFYLKNDDLRAFIANAGYRRTLADHTFGARFKDLFQRMGLSDG